MRTRLQHFKLADSKDSFVSILSARTEGAWQIFLGILLNLSGLSGGLFI